MSNEKDNWSPEACSLLPHISNPPTAGLTIVTQAYQKSASFVPHLTTKVCRLLDPQPTDRILDIGCGDGVLTAQLAPQCASILGLDASAKQIQGCEKSVVPAHENSSFEVFDCRNLSGLIEREGYADGFDKIFSNATLHWVLRDEATRYSFFMDVADLVKPGGKFVFEMGCAGNVSEAHTALYAVLRYKFGVSMDALRKTDPWYFAGQEWVRGMLESSGFEIETMEREYRPTACVGGEGEDDVEGLKGWLRLMAASFLDLVPDENREDVVDSVAEVLEPVMRQEGEKGLFLGYVRLRVLAVKPLAG